MNILLINGPNLNLLGTRESEIYDNKTLNDIEKDLTNVAKRKNIELECFQSNHEEEIKIKPTKNSEELLEDFQFKFNENKSKILKYIKNLLYEGFKVWLLGAGHHASSFISINQIQEKISFVVDDNLVKKKFFLPGSQMPIINSKEISNFKKPIIIYLKTNPENNIKITSIIKNLKKDL